MTELRLVPFGLVMRFQDSLGKPIMLGKMESYSRRGRSNMRLVDSMKESIVFRLQDPSRADNDRGNSFAGSL